MSDGPWEGLAANVYCTNDLAFILPEQRWANRTIHRLEVPTEGEETCVLVMHRSRLEPGDDLDALVTSAVRRAGRERPEHEVLHRNPRVIAGRVGVDLAVRWRGTPSPVYMRQAHLTSAGLWLAFGISGWIDDAEACDRHLERLIETLRLRD